MSTIMSSSEEERTAAATALDIRSYAARTIREEYPYMKTDTLDKILDEMQNHCAQKLLEQEPEHHATKSRTNFFSLSAELRNSIYEMTLADVADCRSYEWTMADEEDCKGRMGIGILSPKPALLQVSQQVREEAMSLYYGIHAVYSCVGKVKSAQTDLLRNWLQLIGPKQAAMIARFELEMTIDAQDEPLFVKIDRPNWACNGYVCDPKEVEVLVDSYGLLGLGVPLGSWKLKVEGDDGEEDYDDDGLVA